MGEIYDKKYIGRGFCCSRWFGRAAAALSDAAPSLVKVLRQEGEEEEEEGRVCRAQSRAGAAPTQPLRAGRERGRAPLRTAMEKKIQILKKKNKKTP